jgi:7tm Chemosensory receptor
MFLLEAHNIYDVIEPLHFCSKIIGLTSFTILQKRKNYEASTTLFNWFCNFILITWLVSLVVILLASIEVFNEENREYVKSEILQKALITVTFAFFATSIISCGWIFAHRQHFALIIGLLADIDEELSILQVPVDLRKHKKVVLIFLFIFKVLIALGATMSIFIDKNSANASHHENIFTWLSTCLCLELSIFLFLHFTFWMWAVKARYEKINLFLQRNFLNFDDVIKGKERLTKVAEIHEKLVDISEIINRSYGVPVSEAE